jgi:hypothetical protein
LLSKAERKIKTFFSAAEGRLCSVNAMGQPRRRKQQACRTTE